MSLNKSLTFNQTVRGITDFIEVAIHTILYSRHPGLNEYISGAVKAIGEELVRGDVDKVIVVIKDKDQLALERFIFSMDTVIQVETFNKETSVEDAMSPQALGQIYLGDDVSFAILLELKDNKKPTPKNDKEPAPWIPADAQHTTAAASEDAELHMIRAVNTGIINLSLTVQESDVKLRRERENSM
ncbi:hypothetical protein E1B28_000814 [Marasmius oreades]|uniref:HORMA domain-containing protein n=1 Tax=Marasmius oreades TaxID=181124 RepID=A0A9P7V2B0_9AGAR|nr:uncharacterized protein E1B28_000814 [Marasmius oreades]KAG7098917.1 hypothetical protein E1B28_000814 [Marasmius oreades]